jgi:hypothetical protein
MPDLENIIRHENEHSALDFKAVQYRKDAHEDLLTDVLAMANADVEGDRHIVVGVKHRPDGTREFLGIAPADFVDPATYQQLVHANIEPEINLDYFGQEIGGVRVGVFKISGCTEQPYMMKKDFGKLRAGEAFVRRGSQQTRLTRPDLDRMLARRTRNGPQGTDLVVSFSEDTVLTEITLTALRELELASDRAKQKIEEILREREEQQRNPGLRAFGPAVLSSLAFASPFGDRPYHTRTDDELRENLKHLKEAYSEDDRYELFENHAFRLNVYVRNDGTQYVEDATVELQIPKVSGLRVASRMYPQPSRDPLGMDRVQHLLTAVGTGYPSVTEKGGSIIAGYHHTSLKHRRITKAFPEPLRIAVFPELVGGTLQLEFAIHGRNLLAPYRTGLRVQIV